MVKKIFLLILSSVILLQTTAFAGDIYKVDTRQLYCFKDIMRAYIDIEDKDANTADVPSEADVSGYIDGTRLTTRSIKRFADTGEGVSDVFLVDISGSIRDSQMEQVRSAIKVWAENMKENDRLALITFGDNVNVRIDFSNDVSAINAAVDGITNSDKNTRLYGGIIEALKLTDRNDVGLPKRKNIILITDGVNDYSGGVSENDVYSELKQRLIPVYSMRMTNSRAANEKGLSTLNSIAEYSGGTTYDMSDKSIDTVYGWIRESILNSCTVDFAYDGAEPDNTEHTFNLKVAQNSRIVEDSVKFIMKTSEESSGTYRMDAITQDDNSEKSSDNGNKKLIIIIFVAALLLILLGALAALFLRQKHNNNYYDEPENNTYNNMNYYPAANSIGKTVEFGYASAPGQTSGRSITLQSLRTMNSKTVPLAGSVSIGRSNSNTFVIDNPTVSGKHAVITEENGVVCIEDLSSVNGTLVNGILITPKAELKTGDILMF